MENKPVILFDGICNFCNATVNRIIRFDKKAAFLFAPLQSEAGLKMIHQYQLPQTPNSFVLIEKNKVYLRSTAALKVFGYLPWYLRWIKVFLFVPLFIRDGIYNAVANNRHRLSGKKEHCMIPSADQKKRFL
ncbi:MAG: DUF393 domain-containing protein [Flavisolibacter sp.]|jgi:predicted DCC family thiol-disulfide oxidoreductase YuxK|nr:DUF393 domain-containing protein [Flavisolibacter sp.]